MTNAVTGLSAALYQDEADEYVVTSDLGSNRDICFVSKNGITNKVEIAVAGNNTPLSVAVVGPKLTINSATGAGGAATSTAAQIVAAVNADSGAFALFEARIPPGSTGAGITGAMAEKTAAEGVVATGLSLTDSGDGLTFQAAKGFRYWDDTKTLTVYIGGVEATSGFTVNCLRGSVTFDADQTGNTITVDCTRRSNLAFQRVLLVYNGKLKINGKDIPTDNLDDEGFGSSIMGAKAWEIASGAYYFNTPISDLGTEMLVKLYSIYSADESWIGKGSVMDAENMIVSPSEAQKQDVTIKGRGEIYPE